MRVTQIRWLLSCLLLLGACSKKAEGKEGGACYGNGTCDEGLACLSKLCVKAPEGAGGAEGTGVQDRYALKSKTTEAVQGVKKIYDGARSFAMDLSGGEDTAFPRGDTGPVPPLGSCCKGKSQQCAPQESLWDQPLWKSLKFSMEDPHYYSYEYESDGTTFTARALGDLDCDGEYSTFELVGKLGPDGEVTGSAGVYRENELE